MDKQQTFIFFGRSGSGKGTQAKLLIEHLNKVKSNGNLYIETGQQFRNFIAKEHNHSANLTRKVLDEGGLMPVFMPIWLWTGIIVDKFTGKEDLILDGLCRRKDEAPVLDSAVKFFGLEKPNIIYINTGKEWSLERLRDRGREDDDKEEDMLRKLNWFDWNVMPAMSYFHESPDYNFIEVNGEKSIEEVHAEIIQKIFGK
ncbi:MAG: adenylate kinase [Patescibacteria group bacterium]|jgi:adenylate kinase family enzyme|nr:adenylate kinase [Patescibacteria group bacterium]